MTQQQGALENPKIRPLEAFPVQIEGKEMVGLKDPVGICPDVVFVPKEAVFLLSLMDGSNSLRDIQAAYMRKYGTILLSEKIEGFIAQLDSFFLLENRNFANHLQNLRDEFKNGRVRKAAFAGTGYEADPERLKAQLGGYFIGQDGPGLPEDGSGKKEIKGIVAPHIDFNRGGTCYAHAYKALGESLEVSDNAKVYCILGTCHTPMQHPFAFTLKTFETPLGHVEVAKDLVEDCAQHLPFDPFQDEFSHRTEHTIEFQVIFLQYLLGERNFTIFPILCGSFYEMVQQGISPLENSLYKESMSILKQQCSQFGKACLVASADLAHVGPLFGHQETVTPGLLAEVRAKDEEMLGHVAHLGGEEFYRFILSEGDHRNICGLPPIYALLNLIEAQEGDLLHYQQWHDPQGKGAVTFASMTFC